MPSFLGERIFSVLLDLCLKAELLSYATFQRESHPSKIHLLTVINFVDHGKTGVYLEIVPLRWIEMIKTGLSLTGLAFL